MRLFAFLRKLGRDEKGATATEYALTIALVAFLSVAAWEAIGGSLAKIFEYITSHL